MHFYFRCHTHIMTYNSFLKQEKTLGSVSVFTVCVCFIQTALVVNSTMMVGITPIIEFNQSEASGSNITRSTERTKRTASNPDKYYMGRYFLSVVEMTHAFICIFAVALSLYSNAITKIHLCMF